MQARTEALFERLLAAIERAPERTSWGRALLRLSPSPATAVGRRSSRSTEPSIDPSGSMGGRPSPSSSAATAPLHTAGASLSSR